MKVLFLDIDGVICTNKSVEIRPKVPFPLGFHLPFRTGWDHLDKKCIKCLNKIIEATDARIVISSTWRISCVTDDEFAHLADYLYSQGIKGTIIDRTPTHAPKVGRINRRGEEIKRWFEIWQGEPVEAFVVLDDDSDVEPFNNHHVCPPEATGLDEVHINQAIEILNGN